MASAAQQSAVNKRTRHRDTWTMVIKAVSGVNAAIVVVAVWLIFRAQPLSFAEIHENLGLRTTWDTRLVTYLFYIMVLGLIAGVVGLVANSRRLKRQYDHLRVNFVLMVAASLIGIVFYLMV